MRKIIFTALLLTSSLSFAQALGGPAPSNPRSRGNIKAVFEACKKETGVKVAKGAKPTKADREKMMSCMRAKNIQLRPAMQAPNPAPKK